MSGSWSQSPFSDTTHGRTVARSSLRVATKPMASGAQGQIYELPAHEDYLYKEYRRPRLLHDARRLQQLVRLPMSMSTTELAVVDAQMSWPSVVVMDGASVTGVLMPKAPGQYQGVMRPMGRTIRRTLNADLLAVSTQEMLKRGLDGRSLVERLTMARSLVEVGALLESHGAYYLDWSYLNVFWSSNGDSAYVIDVDGVTFEPGPQVESPGFEDPLVPLGATADRSVDRFRVSLLASRWLVGRGAYISVAETVEGLQQLATNAPQRVGEVARLLVGTLTARDTAARGALSDLLAPLAAATGPQTGQASWQSRPAPATAGSVTWKKIDRPHLRHTPPSSTAPAAGPVGTPGAPVHPPGRPAATGPQPAAPPVARPASGPAIPPVARPTGTPASRSSSSPVATAIGGIVGGVLAVGTVIIAITVVVNVLTAIF